MGLRVVKDVVGVVTQNGQVIHTGVRIQQDDTGRVAVWFTNTAQAPNVVYAPGEVGWTRTRNPCGCKRDAPKLTLTRLWAKSELAHA